MFYVISIHKQNNYRIKITAKKRPWNSSTGTNRQKDKQKKD